MNSYLRAAALGVIAGSRSMTAPSLLSGHLADQEPSTLEGSTLDLFTNDWVANSLRAASVGEAIADKLPISPDRTAPVSLAGRLVSGTFCGFLFCRAAGKGSLLGAVLGGAGALLGTFGFYHLRRILGERLPLPDFVLGLAEDALVLGGGLLLLKEE